ncbi:hypothetical protein roselon_01828 [Roseibacterium elongatum DSM 19469]|uniref:Uncharacterized protein n=1 Tax=Roseicyclus elongatus DSM 19469 TaxID=1294273 RepID=W8RSL6_9RHOB|nr:hypothetical protein [Roseibacterium elongatum]AHM04194.1 hypothetical protein roselon_01828 [Roseibacterium elongatum DSM 19469]
MSGIGHNGGPSFEAGHGFRKLAWSKARKALLPALPLEVVRVRVARAERLGLPYRTYATIRATAGRDIVAFLFSGNALGLTARRIAIPTVEADRLEGLSGAAVRLGAVYRAPEAVLAANAARLEATAEAPAMSVSWGAARARLRGLLHAHRLPLDGVVLVAATGIEAEWCATAGLAGTIPAERFFDRQT